MMPLPPPNAEPPRDMAEDDDASVDSPSIDEAMSAVIYFYLPVPPMVADGWPEISGVGPHVTILHLACDEKAVPGMLAACGPVFASCAPMPVSLGGVEVRETERDGRIAALTVVAPDLHMLRTRLLAALAAAGHAAPQMHAEYWPHATLMTSLPDEMAAVPVARASGKSWRADAVYGRCTMGGIDLNCAYPLGVAQEPERRGLGAAYALDRRAVATLVALDPGAAPRGYARRAQSGAVTCERTGVMLPDATLDAKAMATPRPVHVMRPGPLYDPDSGELLFDLTVDDLARIAASTNAYMAAGYTIPLSFNHGIEEGQYGLPLDHIDQRVYGEARRFYMRDDRLYADVVLTQHGWAFLSPQRTGEVGPTGGEATALYISPRVRFDGVTDPNTGAALGTVLDVISLTPTPRQNRMRPVELSRLTQYDQLRTVDPVPRPAVAGNKETTMPEPNSGASVLLARGEATTARLLARLGLGDAATAADVARAVDELAAREASATTALTEAKAAAAAGEARIMELTRVMGEHEARAETLARADRERAAMVELARHGITADDDWFALARDGLLAGGEAAERVSAVLKRRGPVDLTRQVREAGERAVARGAYATAEIPGLVNLARNASPAEVKAMVAVIDALPRFVPTGAPPGGGLANEPDDVLLARKAKNDKIAALAEKYAAQGMDVMDAARRARAEVG